MTDLVSGGAAASALAGPEGTRLTAVLNARGRQAGLIPGTLSLAQCRTELPLAFADQSFSSRPFIRTRRSTPRDRAVRFPIRRLADAQGVTSDYLIDGATHEAANACFAERELLKEFQEAKQLTKEDKYVVKKLLDVCPIEKPLQALVHRVPARRVTMNASAEQTLMLKIRTLSPQQVAEVENFVEFLATKARKSSALDRLLAIAPALEAAGAAPMSADEIAAEIDAARVERRARQAGSTSQGSGADRS